MNSDELMWHLRERTIPSALALLPGRMTSVEAVAMLLAVGLQESRFEARRQRGNGPARSFWQFERGGGVTEILNNRTTGPLIRPICDLLCVPDTPLGCHTAMEFHDELAVCFARLLLYVDPRALPTAHDPALGWSIYLQNWRPGKPHPVSWPANFAEGWRVAEGR